MLPQPPQNPKIAIRAPQQQRSADTMARLVDATERLLEERPFEEVSVAEITRHARSSIGAFYARFEDKHALMEYLDHRHAQELIERVTAYSEERRWRETPIEAFVMEMVGFLAAFFKEHRAVLRALSIRARRSADPNASEATQRVNSRLPELVRLVLSRRGEIRHASPDLAVYLGFVMVLGTLRERILFPESYPTQIPVSDSLLADELAKAYLAYLGVQTLNP